jgi:hypothetical protein
VYEWCIRGELGVCEGWGKGMLGVCSHLREHSEVFLFQPLQNLLLEEVGVLGEKVEQRRWGFAGGVGRGIARGIARGVAATSMCGPGGPSTRVPEDNDSTDVELTNKCAYSGQEKHQTYDVGTGLHREGQSCSILGSSRCRQYTPCPR